MNIYSNSELCNPEWVSGFQTKYLPIELGNPEWVSGFKTKYLSIELLVLW